MCCFSECRLSLSAISTNATLSALIKLATITATEWEALKVVIALEPFTREEDNFLVEVSWSVQTSTFVH